jgi:hypothetical protein
MRSRSLRFVALSVCVLLASVTVWAQVERPYRNGSVWDLAFIRVKPGMGEAYMKYLTSQWKEMQEGRKKEGFILSYKVLETESHGQNDWNLILMTEYKDLATMEANEPKEDAFAQKLLGGDDKQMQGYEDRSKIREIVADRLAREVVLEPRR